MPLPTELDSTLFAIAGNRAMLDSRRSYYNGTQAAAYLSEKSREALKGGISRLGVNYCRLNVGALAERLDLVGVDRDGDPDAELWRLLQAAGVERLAPMIHTDRLAAGAAYVTVWADDTGRLTLSGDTAASVHVETDMSGRVSFAGRVWSTPTGDRAVLMTPETITHYTTTQTPGTHAGASSAWHRSGEPLPNPLGRVPVVPFVRRLSLDDPTIGLPVFADILDLVDALNKVLADALVTSEYFARPRRWATGLELEEDDEGNVIDPFGDSRLLQSEAPETKFGQLDPPSLSSYSELVQTITQQIGAITGLPPHYMGLNGDQPASAEGTNAAENQLVQRADTEQAACSRPWAEVLDLAAAITRQPSGDRSARWADTQSRTPAQDADAAAKLHGIGVPLDALLTRLRFTPKEIAGMVAPATNSAEQ